MRHVRLSLATLGRRLNMITRGGGLYTAWVHLGQPEVRHRGRQQTPANCHLTVAVTWPKKTFAIVAIIMYHSFPIKFE